MYSITRNCSGICLSQFYVCFLHSIGAMEKSRRSREGPSRRDDKRYKKFEDIDDFDGFLKKKERELADFKGEADRHRADVARQRAHAKRDRADAKRLRVERDTLQAEKIRLTAVLQSKHMELEQMKQQSERQMKHARVVLDQVFEVMTAPPAVSEEDSDSCDTSEEKGFSD